MARTLFYSFILITAFGCGDSPSHSHTVYFSGEIVNPTSDYVVLYKDDIAIDSAQLDDNNRFTLELDNIKEGLHNFKHAPEYQYVYLEEGDSLAIRLNTSDFDESLVFAGEGSELNNFLLEMFLTNEEEQSLINSFYSLKPSDFSFKIDSLRDNKIVLLNELQAEAPFTENALEIAQASIDYNYYIYKEMYPFYYKKIMGMDALPNLGPEFYAYRDILNLNNPRLTYFRPYYKYINYHLGNLTYMQCMKDCTLDEQSLESYLHYNKHKLALIDSLITEKELRDNVFRFVAIDYLLKMQKDQENSSEFIKTFHELSGNNRHISEIDDLYEGIRNIQPNKPLPDVRVENMDGNEVTIRQIAKDRKVVFYFWSATQRGHFDNIVNRIHQLEELHKDYSFIGINLNTDETRWKSLIDLKGLDKNDQFRSDNYEQLHNALILYPMNKAIIAKDSLIVDAFANLYSTF